MSLCGIHAFSDLFCLGKPAWVENSGFRAPIPIPIRTNRHMERSVLLHSHIAYTVAHMNNARTFTRFPFLVALVSRSTKYNLSVFVFLYLQLDNWMFNLQLTDQIRYIWHTVDTIMFTKVGSRLFKSEKVFPFFIINLPSEYHLCLVIPRWFVFTCTSVDFEILSDQQ